MADFILSDMLHNDIIIDALMFPLVKMGLILTIL